jgi:CspA family cold shock protein
MARTGTSLGTVIQWDDERREGLIEAPDLPKNCWVEARAVVHPTSGNGLRAGQVVQVEWAETDDAEHPVRAVRVEPRNDLQMPGG